MSYKNQLVKQIKGILKHESLEDLKLVGKTIVSLSDSQILDSIDNAFLQKLHSLQYADNLEIRKLASCLLCLLCYQNLKMQIAFCELFDFSPINSLIQINRLPLIVGKLLQKDKAMIQEWKQIEKKKDSQVYWCFPSNNSEFPDPKLFSIGVFLALQQNTVQYIQHKKHFFEAFLIESQNSLTEPLQSPQVLLETEVKEFQPNPYELKIPNAAEIQKLQQIKKQRSSISQNESNRNSQEFQNKNNKSAEQSVYNIKGAVQKIKREYQTLQKQEKKPVN